MIKLEVENYCQNCPHFEADVDKQSLCADGAVVICDTYICCEHREGCARSFESGVKKGREQ